MSIFTQTAANIFKLQIFFVAVIEFGRFIIRLLGRFITRIPIGRVHISSVLTSLPSAPPGLEDGRVGVALADRGELVTTVAHAGEVTDIAVNAHDPERPRMATGGRDGVSGGPADRGDASRRDTYSEMC